MKKMKKQIVALLTLLVLVLCSTGITTHAKKGDIIGKVLYTNILATINDYHIASFNINDYTYIVAEDLQNYGFTVVWDPAAWSLTITKEADKTEVISNYEATFISPSRIGKKAFDIYETDIVTYVGDKVVPAYNINGKTLIQLDNLAPYATVEWRPEEREIAASVATLNWNPNKKPNPSLIEEREAYPGYFMKGDTYLYIGYYTNPEGTNAYGYVDHTSKPYVVSVDGGKFMGSFKMAKSDEKYCGLGDIFTVGRNKYELKGKYFKGNIMFIDKGIILDGVSYGGVDYSGKYVQISNWNVEMDHSKFWFSILSN